MIPPPEIENRLGRHVPRVIPPGARVHAAVALVLRIAQGTPEILFIERAECEGDPWSGHIGFPGGKVEADDAGPRGAAERETLEEIGLDLRDARYLGRLDDLEGSFLPVLISCFVYAVGDPGPLTFNHEVSDAFWFPVSSFLEGERKTEHPVPIEGEDRAHPAVRLLDEGRPVLWGITYRLVRRLFKVLGLDWVVAPP